MRKLRWAMSEGGFWELDVSTPKTLVDGSACPVPGDPLPLGLSRGTKLSRPHQVDFMHRFMHVPLVPSFSKPHGFSLQRVFALPLKDDALAYFMGQFNLQQFISSVKGNMEKPVQVSSSLKNIGRQLRKKSLYALGFLSDFQLTPDDTLHLSLDYTDKPRGKAVFCHKFPKHNLTVEAAYPGLFVEKTGDYWDVPFSMAVGVASLSGNDSSVSYNLSAQYNTGLPKQLDKVENRSGVIPPTLLPGLAFKSAFSYRKELDIWKSEALKLKLVQPYDAIISNPRVSVSGNIGGAATAAFGDNARRALFNEHSRVFFSSRFCNYIFPSSGYICVCFTYSPTWKIPKAFSRSYSISGRAAYSFWFQISFWCKKSSTGFYPFPKAHLGSFSANFPQCYLILSAADFWSSQF